MSHAMPHSINGGAYKSLPAQAAHPHRENSGNHILPHQRLHLPGGSGLNSAASPMMASKGNCTPYTPWEQTPIAAQQLSGRANAGNVAASSASLPQVHQNCQRFLTRPANLISMQGQLFPGRGQSRSPQVQGSKSVTPVARGPQPTSVEPTRLPNGKKIKDVEKQKKDLGDPTREACAFTGPSKSALQRRREEERQQHNRNQRKRIKTTVGNDDSWMKGLTYSIAVVSPKQSFKSVDPESRYKRRPAQKRKDEQKKKPPNGGSGSKLSSLLETIRNLFR